MHNYYMKIDATCQLHMRVDVEKGVNINSKVSNLDDSEVVVCEELVI